MLLQIKNLSVSVRQGQEEKAILEDVSLCVSQGSIFALVGGSGSGKTTTGMAIVRLLDPALRITSGDILLNDQNVLAYSQERMRMTRGKDIAVVFQDPLQSFNPIMTIGQQLSEVYLYHGLGNRSKVRQEIYDMLTKVGLENPHRVFESYPHQLSGGMRQRAMIAQAIALKPQLLIADEPTSSLDVTLQARMIELFSKLRKDFGLAILLITHDLGVVQHLADEVAVMSQGRIIEQGLVSQVLYKPKEEYTRRLLAAV